MMIRLSVIMLILMTFLVSCATLLKDEDISEIKKLEDGVYTLKIDLYDNTGAALPKGTKVKLISKTTNDFVKIYAYNVKEPRLEAKWYLLLYLFQEDFPIEKDEVREKVQYGARSTVSADDKTRYASENYQGDDKPENNKEVYDYNNFLFTTEKFEKKFNAVAELDKNYKGIENKR